MIDKALFSLPGIRPIFAFLFALSLVRGLAIVGQTFTLGSAITNLWNGGSVEAQLPFAAGFLACFFIAQSVAFLENRRLSAYAADRTEELRRQLLERVFVSRMQVVREQGTASVASAALEGIDQVQEYLETILPKMVNIVTVPVVLLIASFTQDVVSGIILLVLYPTIIFYMTMMGNAAKERAAKQYASYQVMSNDFIDTLRGIDTLKALDAGKRHADRIFTVSERFRQATIETLRVATLSSAVLDLIATLGIAAVSVMLGFRLISGDITLFPALVVLIMAPEYFRPIRDFASDFHASLDGKNALASIQQMIAGDAAEEAAGERAENALENATEQTEASKRETTQSDAVGRAPIDAAEAAATTADDSQPIEPVIPTWNAGSHLTLEGISFTYPHADEPALTDISFDIQGFQKVGIVGISGSGKSTLVNLLAGFGDPETNANPNTAHRPSPTNPNEADPGSPHPHTPAPGIRIDGRPVSTLRRGDWQGQALYLPQNPYLFHATLRENLAFYTPDADDEGIAQAIDMLGLQPLVDELPAGLDTMIGESGRGLSGGQAQRIALARVLLDPTRRILLFDEPTAHLDIETEYELKERTLPLMDGHLVFFATHRLHWLRNMDCILVMDGGRIVEQGTLDALLARNGALARLVSRMNGGVAHGA